MNELMNYVARYYDEQSEIEWERMERHRTEFVVTQRTMEKYLLLPPARVLDCGGGPGRYSIWLSKKGYRVTLFDLSDGNLRLAKEKALTVGTTIEAYEQGSATDLRRFEENSFDVVLLMGPLYHLFEEKQRQQAVDEAQRVLKPGGILLASFITRYSAHRYAAIKEPDWILRESARSEELLRSGRLLPQGEQGERFVAYMAHPDEVAPLFYKAAMEIKEILGVEGLVSHIEEQINQLDGELWERWLALNLRVAGEPSIHGCTEHLLVVALKPQWRSVLYRIAQILKDTHIDYRVVGGTNLALHGLPISVRDIDIETDASGAYRIQEIFKAKLADLLTVINPVTFSSTDQYQSHFGCFDIHGTRVEVIGDNQRREDDIWVPTRAVTKEIIDLNGTSVCATWLEEETLAYIRRNRLDRATLCLPHCQSHRLLALMHGEVPTQVI